MTGPGGQVPHCLPGLYSLDSVHFAASVRLYGDEPTTFDPVCAGQQTGSRFQRRLLPHSEQIHHR